MTKQDYYIYFEWKRAKFRYAGYTYVER